MSLLQPRAAYLLENASWFAAFGLQSVLFPWLVTIVLQRGGSELGLVQASLMLPLLLLPLTGIIAERVDRRLVLFVCQSCAAVPALLLALASGTGVLEYWHLIAGGLFYGTMSAFAMPARDAMLFEIAGPRLQATVTAATSVQFGVQILGYLLAGQAEWLGAHGVLVIQALTLLAGGLIALTFLPSNRRLTPGAAPPSLTVLRLLGDTPIPAAMVVNAMIGFFYISAHIVALPLLIRDRFDGGASEISLSFITFILGLVTSNLLIMRLFPLVRLGRAMLLGPTAGLGVLLLLTWSPTFPITIVLLFFWGMGAGLTIASGRTLVQENALEKARARIMALYQLTFLGAAPLGSLAMGWSLDYFGLERTLLGAAAAGALILLSLGLFSNLRHVTTVSAH